MLHPKAPALQNQPPGGHGLLAEKGGRDDAVDQKGRPPGGAILRFGAAPVPALGAAVDPEPEPFQKLHGLGVQPLRGRELDPQLPEQLKPQGHRLQGTGPVGQAADLERGGLDPAQGRRGAALDVGIDPVPLLEAPQTVERGVPLGLQRQAKRPVGSPGRLRQQGERRRQEPFRLLEVHRAGPGGGPAEQLQRPALLLGVAERAPGRQVLLRRLALEAGLRRQPARQIEVQKGLALPAYPAAGRLLHPVVPEAQRSPLLQGEDESLLQGGGEPLFQRLRRHPRGQGQKVGSHLPPEQGHHLQEFLGRRREPLQALLQEFHHVPLPQVAADGPLLPAPAALPRQQGPFAPERVDELHRVVGVAAGARRYAPGQLERLLRLQAQHLLEKEGELLGGEVRES